jgi:hypothetical protein
MDNKPTHMYDVMWGKSRKDSGFRRAAIAAKFEGCTQNFTRLCLSLMPHLRESEAKAIGDCLGDFVTWGNDTGAKDQTLDYKLRKAKGMHKSVVELLTQLQSVLEDGMARLAAK